MWTSSRACLRNRNPPRVEPYRLTTCDTRNLLHPLGSSLNILITPAIVKFSPAIQELLHITTETDSASARPC